MRFELLDLQAEPEGVAPIRRISALGVHWRVSVATYPEAIGCIGRLIFEPQSPGTRHDTRYGPLTLRGRTREELLVRVHDMPDRRLLAYLHSLG